MKLLPLLIFGLIIFALLLILGSLAPVAPQIYSLF